MIKISSKIDKKNLGIRERFGLWVYGQKRLDNLIKEEVDETVFEYLEKSTYLRYTPFARPRVAGDGGAEIQIDSELTLTQLMDFAANHPIYAPMLRIKEDGVFKNKQTIVPKFVSKCTKCESTFDYDVNKCPVCNPGIKQSDYETQDASIVPPNLLERELLEKIITEQINPNGQRLINVDRETFRDRGSVDKGIHYFKQEYEWSTTLGAITKRKLVSVWRLHPAEVNPLADDDGVIGRYKGTCMDHRDKAEKLIFEHGEITNTCADCGARLFPATFVRKKIDGSYYYYIDKEIKQTSEYFPNALGGYPPIKTLILPLELTFYQYKHLVLYYIGNKSPRSIIVYRGDNAPEIAKMHVNQQIRAANNPNYQAMMIIGSDVQGDAVSVVDLMKSPDEMKYTETREEAIMWIAAMLRIVPLYYGGKGGGGGLGNDDRQVLVSNSAIESAQAIYNDDVYPHLISILGIKDYDLILTPPEEKDKKLTLEIQTLTAELAEKMQGLGYDVELLDGEKFDFKYVPRKDNGLPVENYEPSDDNDEEVYSQDQEYRGFDREGMPNREIGEDGF